MFSIYIDGNKLDLLDSNNILINFTLQDLSNPSNRGVKFSNKIKLKNTANNVHLLGSLNSSIFKNEYEVDIYESSIHIIKGIAKVISTGSYVTLQIIDILKSTLEDLKKNMNELDLSDSDFVYNMTNYNLIKNDTANLMSWELTDNRVSTAIDNLKDTTLNPNIAFFRPHYNALKLVVEIFNQAGFTVDVSQLDTMVSNLRLLSNAKNFWIAFYQVTHLNTTLTAGTKIPLPVSGTNVQYHWSGAYPTSKDFDSIQGNIIVLLTGSSHHLTTNHYVDKTKFAIEVDIEEINVIMYAHGIDKEWVIDKKRIIITDEIEHSSSINLSFTFNKSITINKLRVVALAKESEIYVSNISSPTHVWNDGTSIFEWYRTHTTNPKVALLDGFYFKAQYNLPDWTQYDYLKEILTMFNISIELKGVDIKLVHNNIDTIVDITEYIRERAEYTNNTNYSKRNYFKYKNGGKYVLEYTANNAEQIYVELKSDAGGNRTNDELTNPYNLAGANIYNVTTPANTEIKDREVINERFFLSETNDYPTEINADKKLMFGDSQLMTNLYGAYYSDVYDFLQNSKVVKYKVKLNYMMYKKVIDNKFIYDRVIGRNLTVLSVNKYNSNGLTEITAITREVKNG